MTAFLTRQNFQSSESKYDAVARKDRSADGLFVYAVKTTGVYCRPSCPARPALRENVNFYLTPADAERQGYRPCMRCKPQAASGPADHADMVQRACHSISDASTSPPLSKLAEQAGLSTHHFHRIFKSVTGLTPKEYARADRAKRMQRELSQSRSITSAIYNAGYNSNGCFYSEGTRSLGMSPTDFRAGGMGVRIRFAAASCSLGSILVGATDWGVCWVALGDDPETLVRELQDRFPNAELIGDDKEFDGVVAQIIAFVEQPTSELKLPLHVLGTTFQHRVWNALTRILPGQKKTYAELARTLGRPSATRAVAGACAANTLAVLIPCHRIVRTDGSLSGYRWGIERKEKLLHSEKDSAQRIAMT
jgi:AraC family transcriptional regulator of adaptative response/methylated-DNA-[protein]-cysteine methyltransferase